MHYFSTCPRHLKPFYNIFCPTKDNNISYSNKCITRLALTYDVLLNLGYLGWAVSSQLDPKYKRMWIMYSSDRSKVYTIHACQNDMWQIHIEMLSFRVLQSANKLRKWCMTHQFRIPSECLKKNCQQKSNILNTSNVRYLTSMSGKSYKDEAQSKVYVMSVINRRFFVSIHPSTLASMS